MAKMGSIEAAAVSADLPQPARRRQTATISACSKAILLHHGVDPAELADATVVPDGDAIEIRNVRSAGNHVTMTILLPMPYGTARMTITTGHDASILLPGMTLSPAIAASAVGRPVGRLTGHPAFDALADLLVTEVEHTPDAGGRSATILRFTDFAEPLGRVSRSRATALQ